MPILFISICGLHLLPRSYHFYPFLEANALAFFITSTFEFGPTIQQTWKSRLILIGISRSFGTFHQLSFWEDNHFLFNSPCDLSPPFAVMDTFLLNRADFFLYPHLSLPPSFSFSSFSFFSIACAKRASHGVLESTRLSVIRSRTRLKIPLRKCPDQCSERKRGRPNEETVFSSPIFLVIENTHLNVFA